MKRNRALLLLILIFVICVTAIFYQQKIAKKKAEVPSRYETRLVRWFPFSEDNSLKEWEEKIFKNKVVYRIEKDEPLSYTRATSKAAASALYYRIKLDSRTGHPVVSWKWRVEKFPVKNLPESLYAQNEDDFAGRVYVIFPAVFFTNSKVLEYIWAEKLPAGMTGASPYSKNIKLLVLESGAAEAGEWRSEERDIVSDYLKVFGRPPEYDIGAVAFMTNAEHTGTSADAMYDEIKLGYRKK